MLRFSILLLIGAVFWTSTAVATSPCVLPTPEEFAQAKTQSDIIITAQVAASHAAGGSPYAEESWTDVTVTEIFKGEDVPETLRITGWAADAAPLFHYKSGARVGLLLRVTEDGAYRLTDDRWKACVPAVVGIYDGMDIAARLGVAEEDPSATTPGTPDAAQAPVDADISP